MRRLAVAPGKVVAERLFVEISGRGALHRNHIGVDQPRTLEQVLDFFARRDVTLVRTVLHPDAALVVQVGLAQAIGHGDGNHDALRGLDVLGARVNRWANVLRRGIRDQLVQAAHVGRVQSGHLAVVLHTQQQQAATAVGERGQFRRNAVAVRFAALELVAAVFAAREDGKEVGFGHGMGMHEQSTTREPWPH